MKLKDWRIENRYTRPAFLDLLERKGKYTASLRSLAYWEDGFCRPNTLAADAIREATGGKVKPSSFTRHIRKVATEAPAGGTTEKE